MRGTKLKKVMSVVAAAALSCAMVLPLATPAFTSTAATKSNAVDYTKDNGAYRNVMYYADWSIYDGQGNMTPNQIPADQLTHLNFAFLDFDKKGNLQFTDEEAALDAVSGTEGASKGSAGAGLLNALQEVRAKNPNLRTGISVGGWTKSGYFTHVASDSSIRLKFAKNLAKFVKYTGMDFVDIDWEYPGARSYREPDYMDNAADTGNPQAQAADYENYILLLKDIRSELDKLQKENGKYYELSVAISASPWMRNGDNSLEWDGSVVGGTDVKSLFQVVDFVNVMTYDMYGAWENYSYHQTALYSNADAKRPTVNNPGAWNHGAGIDVSMSIDESVKDLLEKGAVASKIVVGVAMYTRGWEQVATDGAVKATGLYATASAINENPDGSASKGAQNYAPLVYGDGGVLGGIWPYRKLDELQKAYPGLKEYWDDDAKAHYMYSSETGAFFTYDSPESIAEKAKYVKGANAAGTSKESVKLGGMIAWMQSNDAESVKGSGVRDVLTKAMKEGLFGTTDLAKYNVLDTQGIGSSLEFTVQKASGGFEITLKNTNKLYESDEVLKELEKTYKSVLTPSVYIQMKNDKTVSTGTNSGTVAMKDGVGIANLYEVSKSAVIEPGEKITFTVKSTATKLSEVGSVIVTQRLTPQTTEIVSQVVKGSRFETPAQLYPAAPTIASKKTIAVGKTSTLSLTNPVAGATVTYSSNKTSVATVGKSTGVVTALKAGTATITCTIKTQNNTYTSTSTITVTSPKFAKTSTSVKVKKTTTPSITSKISGSKYSYASNNIKVAKVNKTTGKITGVKKGTATITCTITLPSGSKVKTVKTTIKVTVK